MLMLYFASRHSQPPSAKMQIGHIVSAAEFFLKNLEMINWLFMQSLNWPGITSNPCKVTLEIIQLLESPYVGSSVLNKISRIIQGDFFHWDPPKSSKYKKVDLG